MKIQKKKDIIKSQLIEKIQLEKELLLMNKHPYIVDLKFSFQSDSKIYFIMEYLPGGDLFSI